MIHDLNGYAPQFIRSLSNPQRGEIEFSNHFVFLDDRSEMSQDSATAISRPQM